MEIDVPSAPHCHGRLPKETRSSYTVRQMSPRVFPSDIFLSQSCVILKSSLLRRRASPIDDSCPLTKALLKVWTAGLGQLAFLSATPLSFMRFWGLRRLTGSQAAVRHATESQCRRACLGGGMGLQNDLQRMMDGPLRHECRETATCVESYWDEFGIKKPLTAAVFVQPPRQTARRGDQTARCLRLPAKVPLQGPSILRAPPNTVPLAVWRLREGGSARYLRLPNCLLALEGSGTG